MPAKIKELCCNRGGRKAASVDGERAGRLGCGMVREEKVELKGRGSKGRTEKRSWFHSHSKGRGNPQVTPVFTRPCSVFVFPSVWLRASVGSRWICITGIARIPLCVNYIWCTRRKWLWWTQTNSICSVLQARCNVQRAANAGTSFFRCLRKRIPFLSALKASRASNDIHFIFSVHSSAAVERESCLRVKRLQYECMHAQVRHVQINMYDSTAVGFLLCMLMILYKFNNASVVHWGCGGGGGGGADTTKIGPADSHKSSFRPPEWWCNWLHLIVLIRREKGGISERSA